MSKTAKAVKANEDDRLAVFLSEDPFVRDLFGAATSYHIDDAMLLISGYAKWIIERILALKPQVIILHRPTRWVVRLFEAAKKANMLSGTTIQIEPAPTASKRGPVFSLKMTGLNDDENRFVAKAVAGGDVATIAADTGLSEDDVKAETERLQAEIIQVEILLARLKQK
ncbi:hypothetical protein [Telmatospirillum sp.]|uniref:hypothetical protein n=1 Tax=Telmatospirillum sp. TaxID=2079197 RepID=UPI00284EFE6E|nr:hypothetical protein [Telmatospirillum sp.]MDR3436036.1 hypothetical protein [Telmatospirillum sp.]